MPTYLSLTSAEVLELVGGNVPETVRSRLDGSKAIDDIFSDERDNSPMNQKFFEVCQQVHDGKAYITSWNVNLEDLNRVTFDFTILAPAFSAPC
jgi:hypothetical protein